MKAADRVILALDVNSPAQAEQIVKATAHIAGYYKVGSVPFTAIGHPVIEMIRKHFGKIFLDLKWHDIPNTISGAVSSAVSLGVSMLNVHACGGKDMMKAAKETAVETAEKKGVAPPLVIAVTVLTSFDEKGYADATGTDIRIENHVRRFASLAKESGLDGVVASPREITLIREEAGEDFVIVTPGIRPAWSEKGDQKRFTAPAEAIRLGADYIVIGRPVCSAPDPADALYRIISEME